MERKMKLTVGQAQQLFLISGNWQLPEKLGDQSYNVAERNEASTCLRELFRVYRVPNHFDRNGRAPRRWNGPRAHRRAESVA